MKIVTSAAVFRDGLGMRLSYTYSEVDDETGRIVSDNNRGNRLITDQIVTNEAEAIIAYAQESVART